MNDSAIKKQRYQDLTREQAFGLEARILQRMFPLLLPRESSNTTTIHNYFRSLIDLTYLLCEVGLGNKSVENAKPQGKDFHTKLDPKMLFAEHSNPAASTVLLVTDALGQLECIRYLDGGLSDWDRKNIDVGNLVAGGAFSLSNMGMKEEVFLHPISNDCNFIFAHRQETEPFLSPDFFSRELWPLPGMVFPDQGMVPAFEMAIFEDWKTSLHNFGLSGIVASYDDLLHGINLIQTHKLTKQQEKTVINNVTLNFGNGSTFTGPLAVGENIKISYDAANSTQKDDLRENLEEVVKQVSKLVEAIESDDRKNDISTQLKSFVEEAKKEKPSKWMMDITSKGLLEAANTVAALATPVSVAVKSVLSLLAMAA